MDDQEDIAEGVPAKSEKGPADPNADGKQHSEADLTTDADVEAMDSEAAAEPGDSHPAPPPRLYRLRPAGLRPVRRGVRRHGLRNDCPPDQRRWPRSSSARTRLR